MTPPPPPPPHCPVVQAGGPWVGPARGRFPPRRAAGHVRREGSAGWECPPPHAHSQPTLNWLAVLFTGGMGASSRLHTREERDYNWLLWLNGWVWRCPPPPHSRKHAHVPLGSCPTSGFFCIVRSLYVPVILLTPPPPTPRTDCAEVKAGVGVHAASSQGPCGAARAACNP
jgi:hypothetical protein